MRFSLANYYLTITSENEQVNELFKDVRIGGEGDALSSINVQYTDKLWDTESFATGAWVHNKNLSKVGTVDVSISQLTDAVAKFKMFVNYFYEESATESIGGCTIMLSDNSGNNIARCVDCYPTQIPAQQFGTKAAEQQWQFTCGEITFL